MAGVGRRGWGNYSKHGSTGAGCAGVDIRRNELHLEFQYEFQLAMKTILKLALIFVFVAGGLVSAQRTTFVAQNRPHGSAPTFTPVPEESGNCIASTFNTDCQVPTVNTVGDVIFATCIGPNGSEAEDDNGEDWEPTAGPVPAPGTTFNGTQWYAIVTVAGADNIDCGVNATHTVPIVVITDGERSSTGWAGADVSSAVGPAVDLITSQCSVAMTAPPSNPHEFIYAFCATDSTPDPVTAVGFTLLQNASASCAGAGTVGYCDSFHQTAASTGLVTGVTLANGGSGYTTGDLIVLSQAGGDGATLQVTTTGPVQPVLSVTVLYPGIGYHTASAVPSTAGIGGSAGTGATFNITSVGSTKPSFVTPNTANVNVFMNWIVGMIPN